MASDDTARRGSLDDLEIFQREARAEALAQVEQARAEARIEVEQVRAEAHAQAEQSRAETARVSEAIERDAEERVARELARVEAFWGVLGRAELRAQTAEAAAEASSSQRVAAIEGMLARAELRARTAEAAAEASSHRLAAIEGSTLWRATALLRRIAERFPSAWNQARRMLRVAYWTLTLQLPRRLRDRRVEHARIRAAAASPIAEVSPDDPYTRWVREFDTLDDADRAAIRAHIARLTSHPLISVVVPVYETDAQYLREMLESVREQIYPYWELCIADDASNQKHVREVLEEYRQLDPRIEVVYRGENGHISAASNSALQIAGGEFVALLDHDDVLAPDALYMMAHAINEHPDTDVLYSDEDKLDNTGRRCDPHFKPDWNPELFYCQNFIGHFGVYRTSLVRAAGCFRMGLEGSQDYDLTLRLIRTTDGPIVHVPHILYHSRESEGSSTFSTLQLDQATAAARRAVEEQLASVGEQVTVIEREGGYHRVIRQDPDRWPKVSVIVPTRDHVEVLASCIGGLLNGTDYPALEILIADNESSDPKTEGFLAEVAQRGVRVLRLPGPFNFSRINNAAAREAAGEILLFLNNDTSVIDRSWLKEMIRHAVRPGVGAVGARLLYPDGAVQHAGVVLGIGGVAGHVHGGAAREDPGYFARLKLTQDVSCVTAACMAMPKTVFEMVGGFDENLAVAFNDVDLCIRIREAGYRIIWTPHAELYHHESKSRGLDAAPSQQSRFRRETNYVRGRWAKQLAADPFFNPNLSLDSNRPELAFPPRSRKPWLAKEETVAEHLESRHAPVATLTATTGPRLAFLTYRLVKGYGVDMVVAEHLDYFLGKGHSVLVVVGEKDAHHLERLESYIHNGQLTVRVVSGNDQALQAVQEFGPAMVVIHTPPFFELLPRLGEGVLRVMLDYGEPPAHLFPNAQARHALKEAKVAVGRSAHLVVGISDFIVEDSEIAGSRPCFLGNDHLLQRRSNLAQLAGQFRTRAQISSNDFVVLNVTRYLKAERAYKGIDLYARVKATFDRRYPELQRRVHFALVGRSELRDRAWAALNGVLPFSNFSDDELVAAYLDSDFYLTTSKWEGCNLGLAQGLAFGLSCAATKAGAHAEFGIPVSNDPDFLAEKIHEAYVACQSDAAGEKSPPWLRRLKRATLLPWRDSLQKFERLVLEAARRTGTATALTAQAPAVQTAKKSATPRVSFLILNKDKPQLLLPCVASIERHCKVEHEILIGDTGSTNAHVHEFYQRTPHTVVHLGFYNFSAGNNILAARARGSTLVLLNNDVELIDTDFEQVLSFMERDPKVGTVGAYLVYPDYRIQHAGVRICSQEPYRGIPEHFDKFRPIAGYPGLSQPRDVVCVTGAFLVVNAALYAQMGGLDEAYRVEAQDADLGLLLLKNGFRNVMHPSLIAFHRENASRTVKEVPQDRELLLGRFGGFIEELYDWQAQHGLS